MANNVIGSLIVNLGLETARLNSDTTKAAKHFNNFEKKSSRSLNNIKKRVTGLMGSLGSLSGIAGVLSVSGLGVITKASIESADKIGKLSDRLGASTEALSQYQHVAELSGVTFETLTMGWQRMTRRVAEAANGTGEAKNALIELNLSAKDLNQLKPEDQFEAIATALSGVTNSADRVRLSMKLFDSGGVSLLQTMTDGASGIRAMRQEADELGITMSKDTTNAAARAADSMTRLGTASRALGVKLVNSLSDPVVNLIDFLSKGLPRALDLVHDYFTTDNREALAIATGNLRDYREEWERMHSLYENNPQNPILRGEAQRGMDEAMLKIKQYRAEVEALIGVMDDDKKPLKIAVTSGTVAKSVDPDAEKRQKALDSLTLQMETEEQRLFTSYANRQFIVEDAFESELISAERHNQLLLQLASSYETSRTAIDKKGWTERQKFTNKSAKDQTKVVVGELINMTAGVAQSNRKMFELNKAAGLANAVVNTYEGVSKSLAKYPWPLAGVMASMHLAAGYAQVDAIKSTSFTGGGSKATIPSSAGTTQDDDLVSTEVGGREFGSQINVYIEGSAIGDEQVRQVIIEAVETAQANDEIIIRTGTGG